MKNNELDSMFENDNKEKKFNEWGSENISFFEDLTVEEKKELQNYYEKAEMWKATWDKTMTAAMHRTGSGIDYSTDIEKSAAQWDSAQHNLEIVIGQMSEKHGKSK